MKTYKNLFKEVCSIENLYKAYLKAKKGKNESLEVLRFTFNLEEELINLHKDLKAQEYKTGKYRNFIIFEPKERKISALPFRDRVVHHSVYSAIEPVFEKSFIFDSYACRKDKGTHAGIKRTQKFIRQVNKNFYVLKCDVSKYFPSVNHRILKKLLRKKISDKKLLNLLDLIIDSNGLEKGIPIGNLTSQLFANIYLNELDKFMKHKKRIKYYIRYMDDFLIIHESKKYLHELKREIRCFLKTLKLELHPKKANVFPLKTGIDFLGYRIFRNYRLVRKSTVKRFLKNIKLKIKNYEKNAITFGKLMESFNSWEAYMSYGDTYALRKSLYNRYFNNIV